MDGFSLCTLFFPPVNHFHEVNLSETFKGQQRLKFTLKILHRMLKFSLASLTVTTNPSGSADAVTNTTAGPDVPVKSSADPGSETRSRAERRTALLFRY